MGPSAPEGMAASYTDYHSPPVERSPLAETFPTALFYAYATPIVLHAAWLAKNGRFTDAAYRRSVLGIRRAFERCGIPIHFENLGVLDRVPPPCVIIGNHMSTAETFLLAAFFLPRRPLTYVVKRQLVEMPIFKHIMRSQHPVVVGREDPRADLKAVLEEGAARLAQGKDLVIFPQRTRARIFNPEDFNTIGVKLARRAGVPVLPLALKTDAWAAGTWVKDFGPIVPDRPLHFALGEPLQVEDSGREANGQVVAFIQKKLAEWGAERPD